MSDELEADVGRALASIGVLGFRYLNFASVFDEGDLLAVTNAPPFDPPASTAAETSDDAPAEHLLAPALEEHSEPPAPEGHAIAPALEEACSPLFDLLSPVIMQPAPRPAAFAMRPTAEVTVDIASSSDSSPSSDGAAAAGPSGVPAHPAEAAPPDVQAQGSAEWSAWPAPRPAPWRPRASAEPPDVADAGAPGESDAPGPLSLAAHLARATSQRGGLEPGRSDAPSSAGDARDMAEVAPLLAVAPDEAGAVESGPPRDAPPADDGGGADAGEPPIVPMEMFRVLSVPREPAPDRPGAAVPPPADAAPALFRRL